MFFNTWFHLWISGRSRLVHHPTRSTRSHLWLRRGHVFLHWEPLTPSVHPGNLFRYLVSFSILGRWSRMKVISMIHILFKYITTNVVQLLLSSPDSSPDFTVDGNRTGMAATDSEFAAVAKVIQSVTMVTVLDTFPLWWRGQAGDIISFAFLMWLLPSCVWIDSCAQRRGLSWSPSHHWCLDIQTVAITSSQLHSSHTGSHIFASTCTQVRHLPQSL